MFSFKFFFVQNRFYTVPELQLSDLSTRRAHIKVGRGKMRGAVEENSAAGEAHCQANYSRGKRGQTPHPFPKYQGDVFGSEANGSRKEAWTQVLVGSVGMS